MRTDLRLSLLAALLGLAAACSDVKEQQPQEDNCDPLVRKIGLPCEDPEVNEALDLLRLMTLTEKVQQMSGPAFNLQNMFDQEDNDRLGIPGYRFMDGPRGVRWYNATYGTTVFPVAEARASSWNLELERSIGVAMADEMRFLRRHVLLAPTINQVSHPRWGRAQESYGEDSFLIGEMGVAFIQGAQSDPPTPDDYRIQACAKHFAANNIEDERIHVNAVLDERTLREVYLPHFKKAADAGVSLVMASYNQVNGSYSGFSTELVRDILKGEWGFTGWVVSDWFAKGNTLTSPVAGLDVEMPFSSGDFPPVFESQYFYGAALEGAVAANQVDAKLVDEAVLRILYAKLHSGILEKWSKDDLPQDWLLQSEDNQSLSLEAARQGTVLLRNGPDAASLADDTLPLDTATVDRVALVGMYASTVNTGDKGSSDAKYKYPALAWSPWRGIAGGLGATNTSKTSCGTATRCALSFDTVAGNEAAIAASDVVIVIVAPDPADVNIPRSGQEGEWSDRDSMTLFPNDLANVNAAIALKQQNPALKIVVILKSGGAFVVDPWYSSVDAIVMGWFGGMREGVALSEILFGATNPSGKVVQSFPVAEADLPPFQNTVAGNVQYGYYHGYRHLDKTSKAARYPFGHGLSYTTFEYSNLVVETPTIADTGTVTVKVDVKNTGPRAGVEVVQLYVGFGNTALHDTWGRPVKELRAFARTGSIAPGATETVTLTVKASELGYWDAAAHAMKIEKMAYPVWVGPSSDTTNPNMKQGSFTIQ